MVCYSNVDLNGRHFRTSLVFKWPKVVRSMKGLLYECHLNTQLNLVWYSDHHLITRPVSILSKRNRTSEFQINTSPLFRCFCNSVIIQIPTIAFKWFSIVFVQSSPVKRRGWLPKTSEMENPALTSSSTPKGKKNFDSVFHLRGFLYH